MEIAYRMPGKAWKRTVAKSQADYEKKMEKFSDQGAETRTRKLNEQLSYKDVLPGADGEFVKYAQKVDDMFEEFMDKAQKLHEEGTELMRADILGGHDSSVKVAERNRYINARVGFLNKLKVNLGQAFEALRREV